MAYNLHRPALAVRLIRAAVAAGWQPASGRGVERDDGFALLAETGAPDELAARPRR